MEIDCFTNLCILLLRHKFVTSSWMKWEKSLIIVRIPYPFWHLVFVVQLQVPNSSLKDQDQDLTLCGLLPKADPFWDVPQFWPELFLCSPGGLNRGFYQLGTEQSTANRNRHCKIFQHVEEHAARAPDGIPHSQEGPSLLQGCQHPEHLCVLSPSDAEEEPGKRKAMKTMGRNRGNLSRDNFLPFFHSFFWWQWSKLTFTVCGLLFIC